MSLVNQNWIGLHGEPVTGRIPPRMLVMNGVQPNPQQMSMIAHHYKLLTYMMKVSVIPFLIQERALTDGTRIRMVSSYGTDTVMVWPTGGSNEADFGFAAIAIRPEVVSWDAGSADRFSELTRTNETLEAVTRTDLLGNARGVTLETEADHLLIRVRSKVKISAGAIKRGDVRISRAKLGHGFFIDCYPRKNTPLMSYGNGVGGIAYDQTLNSFWLAGKAIELPLEGAAPDAPIGPRLLPTDPGGLRAIFATGFKVEFDWDAKDLSGKVFIFGSWDGMLNLAVSRIYEEPSKRVVWSEWETIASAPIVNASVEALYVTEKKEGQSVTYTAKRRNGASAAEGDTTLTATVKKLPSGGEQVTGTITTVAAVPAPPPPPPPEHPETFSATYTATHGGTIPHPGTYTYFDDSTQENVQLPKLFGTQFLPDYYQDVPRGYYSRLAATASFSRDGFTATLNSSTTLGALRTTTFTVAPNETSGAVHAMLDGDLYPYESLLARWYWISAYHLEMTQPGGVYQGEPYPPRYTAVIDQYSITQVTAMGEWEYTQTFSGNGINATQTGSRIQRQSMGQLPEWTPLATSWSEDEKYEEKIEDPHTGLVRMEYIATGSVSVTYRGVMDATGNADASSTGLSGAVHIVGASGARTPIAAANSRGATSLARFHMVDPGPIMYSMAADDGAPSKSLTWSVPGDWAPMPSPAIEPEYSDRGLDIEYGTPGNAPIYFNPVLCADARDGTYIAQIEMLAGSGVGWQMNREFRLVIGNSAGTYPLIDLINEWLKTVVPPKGSTAPPLGKDHYGPDELYFPGDSNPASLSFVMFPV
jgi:hypothetical protein